MHVNSKKMMDACHATQAARSGYSSTHLSSGPSHDPFGCASCPCWLTAAGDLCCPCCGCGSACMLASSKQQVQSA